MPRAAASFFALIKEAENILKEANKGVAVDILGLQAIQDALDQMDQVLGIFYNVPLTESQAKEGNESTAIPYEVLDLVGQRTAAKEAQDWDLADSLRGRITELGFTVKDVKGGGEPIISRLS
jgi:cysteinyl-tRNA synthetase